MLQFVKDGLNAEGVKGTWRTVARESGVDYSVIYRIATEGIKNPSINALQPLNDWLRARHDAHA